MSVVFSDGNEMCDPPALYSRPKLLIGICFSGGHLDTVEGSFVFKNDCAAHTWFK